MSISELPNPGRIQAIQNRYAELLHTHRELLERKNVWTRQRLIQIIKLDLDKLAHALLEVKESRAAYVLHAFFAGNMSFLPTLTPRLEGEYIYHLGFEILEPLDLVLDGIHQWIARTRRSFYGDLHVQDVLRFPASAAFQKRVGAYTEIMRIWIKVEGRTLMLELFDIQRPVDAFLTHGSAGLTHRNFDCLLTCGNTGRSNYARFAHLFNPDDIWHYALYVKSAEDVMQLHADLQQLAAHDARYLLPYPAPVHNPGDGSLHTKIINLQSELELEFVTQL